MGCEKIGQPSNIYTRSLLAFIATQKESILPTGFFYRQNIFIQIDGTFLSQSNKTEKLYHKTARLLVYL